MILLVHWFLDLYFIFDPGIIVDQLYLHWLVAHHHLLNISRNYLLGLLGLLAALLLGHLNLLRLLLILALLLNLIAVLLLLRFILKIQIKWKN